MLTDYQRTRYIRQMTFEGIGEEGQAKICAGHVAIAGLGAIGSAAANMLARAGVGTLTLIDHDIVMFDNLQRQTLYTEAHVDAQMPKVIAARDRLAEINSSIQVRAIPEALTADNAIEMLQGVDVILDAVDDFNTRFVLNETACKLGIPYIYGAVIGCFGNTMSIVPGRTPCLKCLFPQPPAPEFVETAATRGVLASVVNIIASLQVVEVLKALMGRVDELCPGLFQIDVWDRTVTIAEVARVDDCPACGQLTTCRA